MPSPIGHSLAGYAIYSATNNQKTRNLKLMFACILIANLPDFDFLPGFLIGNPDAFHRGISHSLGFAIILGFSLSALVWKWVDDRQYLKTAYVFTTVAFSHILLDLFSVDTSPPFGEAIMWPITRSYFEAPFKLFLDIQRQGGTNSEFFQTIFSKHNLLAILGEIVVLIPLLAIKKLRKVGVAFNQRLINKAK